MTNMNVRAFIIGDPHFSPKKILQGKEFIKRCLSAARKAEPDFIVCLGDILDTHETVKVPAHNLAEKFLNELSRIAHTYLLIGNHDLINHTQFLTTNHIFGPFKKWKGLTIVDDITEAYYGDKNFIFCPYVPNGRFIEALQTVEEDGILWDMATCIFAHQEFKGCKMGCFISETGDEWDPEYPPVISGHIHDAQYVEPNIHYVGSAMQHAFGEKCNKRVWIVDFKESQNFEKEEIDLGLKGKKIVNIEYEDIEDFDKSILEKFDVRINLKATREQFATFRKSRLYVELVGLGVKFSHDLILENKDLKSALNMEMVSSNFIDVLIELLPTKSTEVQRAYENVSKLVRV